MSYDLLFCTEADVKINKEDIAKYMAGLPHITEEWNYQNPNTGVYFSFSYAPPSGNEIASMFPAGYNDTHLAFNINYGRPKFFAEEAIPFVEQLCNTFGILVVDPQDHEIGGDNLPKKAKADHLLESWTRSNHRALSIYKKQGSSPAYIPREKASEWWKYQYHLDNTKGNLGDSIFVPSIFLFADTVDNKVKTAITWTEAIPFVFPKCDKVIIVRHEQQGLFRRNPKTTVKGWMDAEEVKEKLSGHVHSVETAIGQIPALLPEKAIFVKSIFLNLKVQPISNRFRRIVPDSMIDEEIER